MIKFILLGIISSIFQLTIFREFTFSIAKNELSFVVATGVWFVFCSLGSITGIKTKGRNYFYLPFLFSLVFCLVICAIHLAKSFAGSGYYEAVGLGFVFLSSLFLIAPMSFLIGYFFCVFTKEYLECRVFAQNTFAKFFAFEAIGFFIGGVIFTFFLARYSNPFLFSSLPVIFLIVADVEKKKKMFSALGIILLGIIFVFGFKFVLKKEFKGAQVLINKGSVYGPIILAEKFGVQSLYVNGSLLSTSEDNVWNEEFIHTSLFAGRGIKNVLFIGAYFSGQVKEILKHNISSIDCLNINPVLSQLNKDKFVKNNRAEINFIVNDPRLYLENTKKKYDCIIMNMPAPTSLAFNRYFSDEFFERVKKRLDKNGIFSFYIPSKRDILSPRILRFNSCIINTLDRVFTHRLLIPADSMIIIASDTKIVSSNNLLENFSSSKIKTDYFTIYHLRDSLSPGRIKYIENMLDKKVKINSDFYPRGFLYYLLLEQSKFYPDLCVDTQKAKYFISEAFMIIIMLLIGFLSLLARSNLACNRKCLVKRSLLNVVIIGFTSIGFNSIIFVLFQTYSGALFWKIGILTGIFMLGLSLGTFLINSVVDQASISQKTLSYFYFVWTLFIFSLFVGIKYLNKLYYTDSIFYIYSFLSGSLTGAVYPLITKLMLKQNAAPKNIPIFVYAADLTGAFLGTLVFSILFIPFLGISLSLLMLIFLIFVFFLLQAGQAKSPVTRTPRQK